ncbi:MAG: hypothetical protein MJ223_03455 [Mycoplasmoidaceae bacterium]|nr:hypothetical protein [Mycoplasmoidaceae bacterium]
MYLYLRKTKKGMFAVCFLTPYDYAHSEEFKIEQHQVYVRGFELNDLEKFRIQAIEPAKN